MLGHLQDAGNTTTLAHYLELLAGAGMLVGLQKYAAGASRQRGSSPKLQVLNTALMTAQSGVSLVDARRDRECWGRVVESAVGGHLANAAAASICEVFYWRERSHDVDFVVRVGKTVTAIELNEELADRLGIDFDNTPIAPIVVTDVDGVRHRFEIRSMLVGTGHAMYAREVRNRDGEGGYRFAILGDLEADAQDLFQLLRERIRQGLSVRHVQQTEHAWQLTQAHRLSGVIECDPETEGALPLLIVDGRTFTWDQIGYVTPGPPTPHDFSCPRAGRGAARAG